MFALFILGFLLPFLVSILLLRYNDLQFGVASRGRIRLSLVMPCCGSALAFAVGRLFSLRSLLLCSVLPGAQQQALSTPAAVPLGIPVTWFCSSVLPGYQFHFNSFEAGDFRTDKSSLEFYISWVEFCLWNLLV